MANVTVDAKDFIVKSSKLAEMIVGITNRAVYGVGNEILRIAANGIVPHDKGILQGSGHVEPTANQTEVIVGYNTVYAARLHEHPEYNFKNGRQGKYLENPIKWNLGVFRKFIEDEIRSAIL